MHAHTTRVSRTPFTESKRIEDPFNDTKHLSPIRGNIFSAIKPRKRKADESPEAKALQPIKNISPARKKLRFEEMVGGTPGKMRDAEEKLR